jgi:hypothetical protein
MATATGLSASYLDQEQPPPARVALDTPHVQNPVRKEGRGDVGDTHGRPEEAQSEGKLVVLVEVRKVQYHLFLGEPLLVPTTSGRRGKEGASLHRG